MTNKTNNKIYGLEIEGITPNKSSGKRQYAWIEESFHFEKARGRNIPLPQTSAHIKNSLTKKKLNAFLSIAVIFFALVFARIFYLQIIGAREYRSLAENNRERVIPIPAERGLIYDRNGAELTENIPKFSLALTPQDLPRDPKKRELMIARLAELTIQDSATIRETLNKYGSYSYESIVVKEDLDYETALSIQISAADLPGIFISQGSKRLYLPHTASSTASTGSLSHVLGYQGKLSPEELDELHPKGYLPSDDIGKTGVEKSYENDLRGVYGKKRIEVNALGREQSVIAEDAPTPGKNIFLAIDYNMQKKLEEIIQKYLAINKKSKAAGVAMDPNTGELLALISFPAFDDNDFSGGISQENYAKYINDPDRPLFNRAIAGVYPSGSSIKPAIAAAALEDGLINAQTSFNSVGGLRVGAWWFPDWQAGGHGVTNVTKALAWSVNTFFYYIGGGYGDFTGLGIEKMADYLKKFGFAKKLGVDLPGEVSGFLPSKSWKEKTKGERWYIGDTYNVSIGQGDVLVTPLQIAAMTAAIANGGALYQPHAVASIVDPVTKKVEKIAPKIINSNFISRANLEIVGRGMRDCVTSGSCRRLSNLPFSSAGKTGTAQWSSTKDNHAWFTSFAPYENPKIVVAILVEEGVGGDRIAAPIAYEFYKWWGDYIR